ncbi:host specificity factor TipJ family phage tail protein [Comamonas sp. UBA7528]|uniref:host specificity factor TipJ family phage tail protein n=1 Tax=Comamonas sp. UBA7528 TaxID=1946391 RepID=UPI0025C0F849|nr:host specificity factor TipJ family phage tail protein [Comamonas sp. UBA7528]
MEMTRAEAAAVAAVDGMPAELLDAMGRLVVTPHALTIDGQRNVPADLQPGESLAVFLGRHVPGIESGAWVVSIGGSMVPRAMWPHAYPKHGMHIACRAVVAKQAVALVAIAALTYFSGGLAAGLYGAMGGTYVAASAGFALAAIQAGIVIAGSMLINKVLGPKVPKVGDVAAARQVYSLSSQRNSARLYEPLPVLWGEMRVSPDLASQSYTWPEGEDQYMSVILLGGINVHTAADLAIGDTSITAYTDVSVFHNGFSGMPSVAVPLYSNVDTIAGGELPDTTAWVTRTSSAGAIGLHVDLEYQLFIQGNKGLKRAYLNLEAQYRAVGTTAWQNLFAPKQLSNNTTENRRATFGKTVPSGQYEVRMRRLDGPNPDKTTRQVAWTALRTIQADTTDYSQWGRIGIKIKATGQLSGSLDTLRATYRARPLPVWDGLAWATATTREEGLSNPGAIILQTLRGVYAKDRNGKDVLQWGYGMSDEQIDIEGLKAFMLHCKAKGYTYDRWVTQQMSLQQFCDEVALAGMGQFTWTDGSRPTVAFVSSGQPISAVVNMANMKKAGFSVDYVLGNAADGIEYQYLDRNTWETKTLRVMAPGVTTMLNPARVTGEGVTSEAHAAVLARYHLAQSLYQFKTVNFQADIEHLDYRRLSVLSVSHDLTQWGFGGRVMAAQIVGSKIRLQLDEPVPPLATPHMGLRIPGERDYRVWPMVPMAEASDVVELVGEWPAGVAFPGDGLDNPAHDTLWCADFKPTPGYRVRVTGIEPESDLSGAAVSCVPEGPEFWDYVLNGTYVPAPNQSTLPQLGRPNARDLRVQEQVNVQGDTEWYELHVQWEVDGDYDHAQVWAGRDGSELRLVDGNATGTRTTFRIDGAGEWLIEVRPFSPGGRVGQSAALLYITTATQVPPRNPGEFAVMQVDGGLRRFMWSYAGDKPAALAGVQIRYLPGDVPLTEASWEGMQPLGVADDVYTAQFETTKPEAGQWTFGLRAIDTAGLLAPGVVRTVVQLDGVFDDIFQPDLTPPPTPTGFQASAALTSATLQTDLPTYEQGHGHASSNFYVAEVTAEVPNPGFAAARLAAAGPEHIATAAVELGKTYRFWAKWKTVDGVESLQPAGPVTLTVGKVGNSDLGALVVEAENLANSAVTAAKLAAQAVDATKFASGIEPVGIVASGALPTVKGTSTIVYGGKLYRWDGSKYTAATAAADVSGQIGATQIADGAISTPKLAANAVTAAAIAAGAITAAKLAADSVTAAAIAAGAVNAEQIAAGAITASKMVISDASTLVPDPEYMELGMWTSAGASVQLLSNEPNQNAGTASKKVLGVYRVGTTAGVLAGVQSTSFPVKHSAAYTLRTAVWPNAAGSWRVSILWYNPAGNLVSQTNFNDSAVGAGWRQVFLQATAPTTTTSARVVCYIDEGSAATYLRVGKLRVAEATSAELIVDGAITAAKMAANAIAVGTAAIQDGAIVNAMIGNLSADKITAGTLAAARIAAGSITASHLATNSVTTDKIAAGSVTANELSVAAVTAAKIAAKTITAAQLAAGAVTATEINVSSLSAIAANLGTVTAGRIQNAANTSFWNLGATGATRMFQLGSDLSYDEANGLRLSKLNVIEMAQLAPGSVSQSRAFSGGPVTITRNTAWSTILSFTLPAGKSAVLSGFGDYVFNSLDDNATSANVRLYEADLQVVVGSAVAMLISLSPTGRSDGGSNSKLFSIPGCVADGSMTGTTSISIHVRSVSVSPAATNQRQVNSLTLNALIVNR